MDDKIKGLVSGGIVPTSDLHTISVTAVPVHIRVLPGVEGRVRVKSPIIRLPQQPGRMAYRIYKENLEGQPSEKIAEQLGISLEKAAEVIEFSHLRTIKSLNQPVKSSLMDQDPSLWIS